MNKKKLATKLIEFEAFFDTSDLVYVILMLFMIFVNCYCYLVPFHLLLNLFWQVQQQVSWLCFIKVQIYIKNDNFWEIKDSYE